MLVISPAAILNSIAIGTVNLGMLFIVKDVYQASASVVGWLGALWSLSYFAGCFALKRFTARMVPRNSMTVMQAGSALLMAAFLLRPGLLQAFITICGYGFITAFFWPPLMGWMSRGAESKDLAKATGIFNFSWSLGAVISPYLAGLLSEQDKFLPIIVATAIFSANGIFIQLSKLFIKDHQESGGRSAESRSSQQDRSTPLRYPAWLGITITYMIVGVALNIFPVFARDVLKISESTTGFILTLRALTTMISFMLLGRLSFWQFKPALIPLVSGLMTGLLLTMVFIRTPLAYMICFALFGVLMALVYNNSLFYATSGALDRDKRVNVHEALLTGGQVVGSISGGFLYQLFSLPPVFILLSVILGAGALAQLLILKRRRPMVSTTK